jgi:tRNA A37 methylthiotransferase MiaB
MPLQHGSAPVLKAMRRPAAADGAIGVVSTRRVIKAPPMVVLKSV